MSLDEPLTTGEIASLCHVSHVTVFRWIKRGILPAYTTPGGHYRVPGRDFLLFLEEQGMPVPASMRTASVTNILVVDDDSTVLDTVSRALNHGNQAFHVERARNGYEACIKIGDMKPHLIILDLIMPGVDGFEVMKVVRSHPEMSHCRILVLSGYASDDNLRRARENGADEFLHKPVEMDVLLGKINEMLSA